MHFFYTHWPRLEEKGWRVYARMSTRERFAGQDPRVISVFEVVGAYFTDTYFNHVYGSAKTTRSVGASLSDEYRRHIQAYVLGVKNDASCYKDVVQGVHQFFAGTTRFTSLSFAEFVDRVVEVCVPGEYFHQLPPGVKDELLSHILCDLAAGLAAFATTPDMLSRIVDGHATAPEATVRALQDAAVDLLITKRVALHNKFLCKLGEVRDTVQMDVVHDMKKVIVRLAAEKKALRDEARSLQADLEAAQDTIASLKVRDAKLRRLVSLLQREKEEGAAAVGASLRVPSRDTLAEGTAAMAPPRRPPPRDRIAEHGDEDEDDRDGHGHSHGHDRGHAAAAAAATAAMPDPQTKVTASFFKSSRPAPALATAAAAVPIAAAAPIVVPAGPKVSLADFYQNYDEDNGD